MEVSMSHMEGSTGIVEPTMVGSSGSRRTERGIRCLTKFQRLGAQGFGRRRDLQWRPRVKYSSRRGMEPRRPYSIIVIASKGFPRPFLRLGSLPQPTGSNLTNRTPILDPWGPPFSQMAPYSRLGKEESDIFSTPPTWEALVGSSFQPRFARRPTEGQLIQVSWSSSHVQKGW